MLDHVISCDSLSKRYHTTDHVQELTVLKDVSLTVKRGESLALVGKSGSGKSTLLQLLAGLMPTDSGNIIWHKANGENLDLGVVSDEVITKNRNRFLGFVFQFHHLLPEFNALENVMLPMMIAGLSKTDCKDKATDLLQIVGLEGRFTHFPSQLSGGEQQRVAICRAVANNPELILADEPTGNLDEYHSAEVLDLLQKLQEELNVAMILATHDRALEARCQRVLFLSSGELSIK